MCICLAEWNWFLFLSTSNTLLIFCTSLLCYNVQCNTFCWTDFESIRTCLWHHFLVVLNIVTPHTPNNSYHTIYPIIIIKRLRKYFTFQFRNANTEFDTVSVHFIYNYHQNDSPRVLDVGNATRKKTFILIVSVCWSVSLIHLDWSIFDNSILHSTLGWFHEPLHLKTENLTKILNVSNPLLFIFHKINNNMIILIEAMLL